MRRITHLITSLKGGGTEAFLYQMLRHAPAGLEQAVLYLKDDGVFGDRIRALGIPVQPISTMGLYRHLRERRPEVLHTCLFRAHQIGRIVGKVAGVARIVSSQRAIDSWMQEWHRELDGWTLRACDLVLANSKAAQACVESHASLDACPPVQILPNPWSPSDKPARERMELRRAHGWEKDWILGGALMRLHPEKGADLIPGFANQLLAHQPKLHLVIAGSGPLEDELKRVTRLKPWASRVHWLGWIHDSATLLPALDFAWLLSREESYPQALLEASCAGLPWIAPRVGGIPDLIEEGAVGELFASGSATQAAQAGETLLKELEDRKSRARSAATPLQNTHRAAQIAHAFYDHLARR